MNDTGYYLNIKKSSVKLGAIQRSGSMTRKIPSLSVSATGVIYQKISFLSLLNITNLPRCTGLVRVVNGPTSSGPNPKTNLKPKSCPKKKRKLS